MIHSLIKNLVTVMARYVLLFTCLVLRAAHLEFAVDLTTDSKINCIRRFVNRRGKPKKFFSHCGKAFVGSNNSLQSSIASLRDCQHFESQLHLMQVKIEWVFNPLRLHTSVEVGNA